MERREREEMDPEARDGEQLSGHEVAIVGMAARVPGALDVDAFWKNLRMASPGRGAAPAGRQRRGCPGPLLR